MKWSFITVALQSRSKHGEETYDPYDWDSEEDEEVTERRKTRSSAKPAAKPTTAAEMEADRSDPADTVAGPSSEPATPAVIADDRWSHIQFWSLKSV
jgi:hypothetical protein